MWSVGAKQYHADSQTTWGNNRREWCPADIRRRGWIEMAALKDRSTLQSYRKGMVRHLLNTSIPC